MKTKNNITGIRLILTAALAGGLFSTAENARAQAADPTPIPVTALRNNDPYNFVGKITTDRGSGSGTVIKPYSVLTAGHVLYTPRIGFKDTIRFWRAYSKSNTYAVNTANGHICRERWVLRGYTENVELYGKSNTWSAFSRDTGAIIFWTRPLLINSFISYAASTSWYPRDCACLRSWACWRSRDRGVILKASDSS